MVGRQATGLLLIALLLLPGPAQADSPYELSWGLDGALLGTAGVAAGAGFWLSSRIEPISDAYLADLDESGINGLDRHASNRWSPKTALASDFALHTLLASPVLLAASKKVKWEDAGIIGTMYVESLLITYAAMELTKNTVLRSRPYAYAYYENPDVHDFLEDESHRKDARRSFYSGHTAYAFTSAVFAATVFGDYHPDSPWTPTVWLVAITGATSVGIMRIAAGRHFPTDVLTGAIAGVASGYLVPWAHRKRQSEVTWIPAVTPNGAALTMLF